MKNNSVQEIIGLCYFFTPLPPMPGTVFSEHKNWQVLSTALSEFFKTKLLDTNKVCHKSPCMGSDVSKFHPSIGKKETYWRQEAGDRRKEAGDSGVTRVLL